MIFQETIISDKQVKEITELENKFVSVCKLYTIESHNSIIGSYFILRCFVNTSGIWLTKRTYNIAKQIFCV